MAGYGFVKPVIRVAGRVQAVHAYLTANAGNVVDTSDATATAEDLASGKSAYVQGKRIVGSVSEILKLSSDVDKVTEDDGNLEFSFSMHDRRILGKDVPVIIRVPINRFGTASAEDVAKGKTFTSENGFVVEGAGSSMMVGSSFAVYGDEATVVFTTELDAAEEKGWLVITGREGVDTADASATEDDIARGKTAYARGEKITGRINQADWLVLQANGILQSEDELEVETIVGGKTILSGNASIKSYVALTEFGTATAADVRRGKTFTSASGLTVAGTASVYQTGGDVHVWKQTGSDGEGYVASAMRGAYPDSGAQNGFLYTYIGSVGGI